MFQKFTLYEESIRVPLAISDLYGKYVKKKGDVCSNLVSGIDIFGTLCDYAGITDKTKAKSLRPVVEEKPWTPREFAYVENNYWGRAIITEDDKLIMDYIPGDNMPDFVPPRNDTHLVGDIQLFSLQEDSRETCNLAKDRPEKVKELLEKLREFESGLKTERIHPLAENLITRCQKRVLKEYHKNIFALHS